MGDLINALFELFGGFFILLSVRRAYIDKKVAGVSWLHVSFFTFWGVWNLYYYPSLGQYLSFYGGCFIVVTNTIWVGQLIHYSRGNRDGHGEISG